MSESQPLSQTSDPLSHPLCPKCSGPMVLTQSGPDQPGFVRRIFDCGRCGHQEIRVFEILSPPQIPNLTINVRAGPV